MILFIILNVLISLAVAYGVISLYSVQNPAQSPPEVIRVEVLVTATVDVNATIPVRIITATPGPGLQPTLPQVAQLPTDLLGTNSAASAAGLPTLDATTIGVLGGDAALSGTATALPAGCIPHVLKEGDTPFAVAEIYGADPFRLLEVNGLDEAGATFLQIGDVLIVPLEFCPLGAGEAAAVLGGATVPPIATATPAQSATPTASGTAPPTVRPTVTLAPTAANAAMRIVEVLNAGDVTAESVAIRNTGAIVDIGGWTLSDADGNTYTFAQQRLFTNAQITLFTRVGSNSPVALYWGRDTAAFQSGDTLTLRDASGNVQSTYRVP
jgi:hypothetical protein